jgi:TetR/AcrR family transcriptional regulator, fatty acid metabolism regulator protein
MDNLVSENKVSFIEEARRKQIIAGAVKTVARRGLINTTLAHIAKEIHVSKGVISYYFQSKTDLIAAVFDYLKNEQRTHRHNRIALKPTPTEKLIEYIRSDMEFYQQHREEMMCWWELWGIFKSTEEKRVMQSSLYGPPRETLIQILQSGQQKGEFEPTFDPLIVAITLEGAIEGVMTQWIFEETAINMQQCTEELITLFSLRILKE